jgi:hypothetical protein
MSNKSKEGHIKAGQNCDEIASIMEDTCTDNEGEFEDI